MNKKDILKHIFIFLSIISLITVIIIGSLSALLFNKEYYNLLYAKTGTYERLDKELVSNKTDELFLFLKNKSSLDTDFYTENEISHLKDVKNIMKITFIVYYLSLFLLLVSICHFYIKFRKEFVLLLSRILNYSGITIFIIAIIFFMFNFSGLFEIFHKLLFKGNYTFPYTSNMIKMFSEDFFKLFAEEIFKISIIKTVVSLSIGSFLIWKTNKK